MLVTEVSAMKFVNSILFACLLWLAMSMATQEQSCHPVDLLALKEFVGNLTNTSISSSWFNDLICCNWDGIVCEESLDNGSVSNRVVILNLSGYGIRGVISQSLSGLDHLKVLDLSYNRLEGGFPSNILMNLKRLEVLDLSHNMLMGPVSQPEVGSNSVYSLNISSNFFNGTLLDLGEFRNIVVFNASNNSLTGGFNSRICSSSNKIRVLDLSRNRFNGGLEELENCSRSLRQFHVDSNSFSGQIPESLYSFTSLEKLTVSGNNFSGNLSKNLGKLFSLKSLLLSGNPLMGPVPNVFTNMTQLEYFVAHSNSFSGPLPSTLAHCSKLRVLDLRNNSLSGSIHLNFTQLPLLCTLELASNSFHGALPSSLSSCQELRNLNLAKNKLSGQIPESYAKLTSLELLSLSNNTFSNLTGALTTLQHCKNLTALYLARNFHGEEIPRNVSGFKSLTTLALGNCAIKGGIPVWLLNCTKLQVLDLSWNHLNGSIPHWIGQMESLFYMDFSNNSLTGEIPKSLTDLKRLTCTNCSLSNLRISTGIPLYVKRNLTASGLQYNQPDSLPPTINLGNNKINGTIWPEFGKLKQLHILDLSKNNITGTIPSSISDMGNIESLDLSNNNLYGTIPTSLNKLTFLSSFSVANNHLHGTIPTGGQFLSFPSSSFEGNSGLCGGIVSTCNVDTNMALQPRIPSGSKNQFGRGSIFGVTISIGVGIALLLAVVLLRISRRGVGYQVEGFFDEENRSPNPNTLSASFGSSKLVLFHNSDCKDLSIADLLKSTNNFSQANIIGCGGFGLVYKAELPNGSKAAVKRLSGDCDQIDREFQAEVEALSRAQHKNLVSLQGYCRHGMDRLLIYSYMENGSLDYWLHETVDDNGPALNWHTRLKIAQGAAHGLAYLHKEPNIVHRDVKTSNILLDDKFEAHLADFGLSRLLRPYDTHVTTDLVGTLGYIPPEYSQTLTATFRGDVYSFGVVLLELLTGRRPVEVCKGKNCRDLVSWIIQMKLEKREVEIFDSSIWDKNHENSFMEVFGIACKCIDQDPRRRPSIDQVVSWLDRVGTESLDSATD